MPYSVKGFFEINEDMVQILLMLEVLFTQNSKVEDLFIAFSSIKEMQCKIDFHFTPGHPKVAFSQGRHS